MIALMEIQVTEFGQVRMLALDRAQRDALLSCRGDLTLAPEPGTDNLWSLRTGSHVGTVAIPGMTLRIRPKVSIPRLFVMLSAATGSIRWDEQHVGFVTSAEIEDVMAIAFLESVSRALPSGLLRGYISIEEESFVVRGQLDLAETIRRRPTSLAPVVQTPEFLDENITENRILATALVALSRHVRSPSVRARLLDCHRAFATVQPLPNGAPLPRVTRNRLNTRWWGTIELAILVLRSCGLDQPAGSASARAFLVDMNVVFEQFIFQSLAQELDRVGVLLRHNHGGMYLDGDGHHGIRPDLSIWHNSRCVVIADCKYKQTDHAKAHRDDVYQCLAYAAATGLSCVTLFYVADADESRELQIVDGRTSVRIRTVHLAAPVNQLRARLATLATEITRLL